MKAVYTPSMFRAGSKVIGGKKYTLRAHVDDKGYAYTIARNRRQMGWNARVSKRAGDGYDVWIRWPK